MPAVFTHMPPKLASALRQLELSESTHLENDSTLQLAMSRPRLTESRKENHKSSLVDQNENC